MADLSAKPLFMPAPRPSPRTSGAQAEALLAASADLGFARPTQAAPDGTKPSSDGAKRDQTGAKARDPAPKTAALETKSAVERGAPRPIDAADPFGRALPLRLDVPEDLWRDLKIKAAERRVTVRWLVLEALEQAGYAVATGAIPEDGRRVR
jgi:hypothetical protein